MTLNTSTLSRTQDKGGTTGDGGEYASFATWVSNHSTIASGDQEKLICYRGDGTASGNWDTFSHYTAECDIDGFTGVTATSNILIEGAVQPGGKDEGFVAKVTGTGVQAWDIGEHYTQLKGVSALGTSTANNNVNRCNADNLLIERCWFWNSGAGTENVFNMVATDDTVFRNNVCESEHAAGCLFIDQRGNGSSVINNTLIHRTPGTYNALVTTATVGFDINIINNVFYGQVSATNLDSTNYDQNNNGYYDIADDIDESGSYALNTSGTDFADYSNSDYDVTSTGSAMYQAGENMTSASESAFSDDINGNTRPSSAAWTGGAYEYQDVGGGPTIPIFEHHYRMTR